MSLFKLRIRKQFFYLFEKYFTIFLIIPIFWGFFGGMSIAGMWPMGKIDIPIMVKTLSVFIGEEDSKPQGGSFVFKEYSGVQDSKKVGFGIVPQFLSGFKEGTLEIYSSFIKFFSPVPAYAKEVSEPTGNNRNNGTADESNEVLHIIISFTLGYCLTAFLIVLGFKYYDHRSSQR